MAALSCPGIGGPKSPGTAEIGIATACFSSVEGVEG